MPTGRLGKSVDRIRSIQTEKQIHHPLCIADPGDDVRFSKTGGSIVIRFVATILQIHEQ